MFTRNTYQAAITDTAVINSNTLNDARFEFLLGSPITQFSPVNFGPQLYVSGYYTYGESRSADLSNHQYEWADTLSMSRGHHQIKVGFDVMNSYSGGFGQEFGGGYVDGRFQINPLYEKIPIATLMTYNPGLAPPGSPAGAPPIALQFTQSFGNQNYRVSDTLFGVFAQDNWNIAPNFNLNLGLRWDGETFTGQNALFSPRVGFAWKLPGSNTVLRGGYGIYYQRNAPTFTRVPRSAVRKAPLRIPRFREDWDSRQPSRRLPSRSVPCCPRATLRSWPVNATISTNSCLSTSCTSAITISRTPTRSSGTSASSTILDRAGCSRWTTSARIPFTSNSPSI